MTESADIDGDGDQDLVAANDTVSVLRNGGGGRFETTAEFIVDLSAYDLVAVALTDLDGDADADLVALSNAAAGVYVLPNDGTGTFGSSTGYWSGGGDSGGFALGDLDGDGDRDIVCVSGTLAGGKGGFANVLVLLNDGDGTFQYGEQHGLFGKEPYRVAVGDLDGDSDRDIAVSFYARDTVGVFANDGDATFAPLVEHPSGGDYPVDIEIADVDGDSDGDVVVAARMCYR